MDKLDYAKKYLSLGLLVFPLQENTKSGQVVTSWLIEASKDEKKIHSWWNRNKDFNIGVRTGNGLIVIDVDNKNDKNGEEAIKSYINNFPQTFTVKTPNKGFHLYYRVDKEVGCKVGLYSGIDIRGEHGYVVGAGSNLGVKKYEILKDIPIAMANEAVYQFIENEKPKMRTVYIYEKDKIVEGTRNDTLFKLATSLKGKGLSHAAIESAIRAENLSKCFPPLDDKEIETICNSVEKQFSKRDKCEDYHPDDEISTRLKTVDEIQIKKLEWLVDDLIPKNQVTIFAGDGGVGKTSVWAHIAAKLSKGDPLFFETETSRRPMKVIYFSGEDPTDAVLKKKLLDNHGDIKMIRTIDVDDERLQHVRFDTRYLKNVIVDNRPDIVIFDPLQSFLPEHTNMSARNQMREAMNHLLFLARKYEVTFLVMVHTNKKSNASGRERAADSADIWDISRSFLFVGTLNDNVRYLSNEKNNYAPLQKTYLFKVGNGAIEFVGVSDKKDIDFQNDKLRNQRNATSQSLAKEDILNVLKGGEKTSREIEEILRAVGYSPSVIDRAKTELRKEKLIDFRKDGSNREGNKQDTIYFLL